jgi:transcriptional regulator with XRE-family HTH domain
MPINISKKAKEFRIKNEYSVSQVATLLNMTDHEYLKIENGASHFNYMIVLELSKLYRVPVSYLYNRSKSIVDNLLDQFVNSKGNRTETDDYIEYTYNQ